MKFLALARRLPILWYRRSLARWLVGLLPFSWLFRGMVGLRYGSFRRGWIASYRLPVPVVVVGNLTVGGSGKTPLVLWLVARLRELGWHPGIISRGYGGTVDGVQCVSSSSRSDRVGDEPLLLARRSGVPVCVGRDRVAAGRLLLSQHPECDVIVSDDGLQHYRLRRTVELVVFDGRGIGNGHLLPAGPLREPVGRLHNVDAIVWNTASPMVMESGGHLPQFSMSLEAGDFYALSDVSRTCMASDLRDKRLHAIAGIGDPARFFSQLSALGLTFTAHPFPDHHAYGRDDFGFVGDGVLLMTEKDAVKCLALDYPGEAWVLPVEASIRAMKGGKTLLDTILEKF